MKRVRKAPPTERQREFLEAIAALDNEASAMKLAARLGITDTGARPQLRALEDKGLIEDTPRVVRSGKWRLTARGRAELAKRGSE